MASTKTRKKKLDPYEMVIQTWLSEHPDLSASQIYDWLMDKYPQGVQVGESTVRNYVRELRKKYGIPKTKAQRIYQAIPDPPMGKQAQVDFGQTLQKTSNGTQQKMYFISFVLSHSRYKYVLWLDRPFVTKDVIQAHEQAFQYFGGIPEELVYDQDSLILVSENAGDLILTSEFQAYRQERKLQPYMCRKSDPESKGKIENVVKFIKHNFAKHRIFVNLDQWNEACLEWLQRTGNGKVHNTTKKRPVEVFALERRHLRPVTNPLLITNVSSSITRTVRKDNTIIYQSNRYSVPLGTYGKHKEVYIEVTEDHKLIIRETADGPIMAKHLISLEKGKLIQDSQHLRDRTKGISAYIQTVAEQFEEHTELAMVFLREIHRRYPRYIRDQLRVISKAIQSVEMDVRKEALTQCVDRNLYSASEFKDVIAYITHPQKKTDSPEESQNKQAMNASVYYTQPEKREVDDYLKILGGETV